MTRSRFDYLDSRFAITRVIVLESNYLFLTEGMHNFGYITLYQNLAKGRGKTIVLSQTVTIQRER